MLTINPIGHIRTPYKQKFGIPRQSNLAEAAIGKIIFSDDIQVAEACFGLEEFSHLWLIFCFHEHLERDISMTVRPPRLGGKKRIGVFATRSSFRPNHLGLSVVKNIGLDGEKLIVGGADLLDKTPIIDIKPYISYADSISDSTCGYASTRPDNNTHVEITKEVLHKLPLFGLTSALIKQVLSQDPRPAHATMKNTKKHFRMRLNNADICWEFDSNAGIRVFDIVAIEDSS